MAVVKMGQIKSTPAKALAYISRPDATADGLWVSTNAETIIDPTDFKAIARQFDQTVQEVGVSKPRKGSVLAHHVIQSFDPKDGVDTKTAHRIGTELAERLTGGSHEYMIATHLDKGHVHNHIIFNAVNRETGRKFRVQRDTIGKVRDLSDELSLAQGLSILPRQQRATGRSMADIYRTLKGESGKQFIRTEIDKAAMAAKSWNDFEAILGRAGIEVYTRGGKSGTLSFREISMARPVRDYRLGLAYTESSIMSRISREVVNKIDVDVSMVTRETSDTLSLVVPGTRRQLHLNVPKNQVVRHGRSLRIYIPSSATHHLADAKGNLAQTVKTAELYSWFSEPSLVGSLNTRGNTLFSSNFNRWNQGLNELRELEASINAKSRWMLNNEDHSLQDAITNARSFVSEKSIAYQTTLVALTEHVANGSSNTELIDGMKAQLRITEREIEEAKSDIQALTKLNTGELKMSISDRINRQAEAARANDAQVKKQQEQAQLRQQQEARQRRSREVAAGDAEPHSLREQRAQERSSDAVTLDDANQDRDGGTRSMTLQDRLELEANKLRSRNKGTENVIEHKRNEGRQR